MSFKPVGISNTFIISAETNIYLIDRALEVQQQQIFIPVFCSHQLGCRGSKRPGKSTRRTVTVLEGRMRKTYRLGRELFPLWAQFSTQMYLIPGALILRRKAPNLCLNIWAFPNCRPTVLQLAHQYYTAPNQELPHQCWTLTLQRSDVMGNFISYCTQAPSHHAVCLGLLCQCWPFPVQATDLIGFYLYYYTQHKH